MVKIAMYKKHNGELLVVWKTRNENLIGELFNGGEYNRGKWDARATFLHSENEATEHRVKEYFGFNGENSTDYWKRWA